MKGFWIVFEDIDKAPTDVQSILLPLLEGSSSFSIGHAEVKFAFDFCLFDIIIMQLFKCMLEVKNTYVTCHGLSLTCRCLLILKFLTQAVEVAESFRLFATVTTSKHDVSHALEGSFVWLNYCVITSALLR